MLELKGYFIEEKPHKKPFDFIEINLIFLK